MAGKFVKIRCLKRGELFLTFTNITIEIISKDGDFHTFIEKLQAIFNTFYPSVEVPFETEVPSLQELSRAILKKHDYSKLNEELKDMIEKRGGKRYAQSKFKVSKKSQKVSESIKKSQKVSESIKKSQT